MCNYADDSVSCKATKQPQHLLQSYTEFCLQCSIGDQPLLFVLLRAGVITITLFPHPDSILFH